MDIFGFKINWRMLKEGELGRVFNFLATHMTEREIKEEQIRLEKEMAANPNRVAQEEMQIQGRALSGALMLKKFSTFVVK